MKALPFPCIRPAQDRVLEALPAMGSILSGNDALRGAIADGLMLKDPGAAYYVYECSGEPGRVTGVVAICPVGALAGGDEAAADTTRRCARNRRAQGTAASRIACLRSVARHGYHPRRCQRGRFTLRRHRSRRHYAPRVGGQARGRRRAIRAMLDQAPEPALADDPAYAVALVGASQLWPTMPVPPAPTRAKSRSTLP